jgi:hypothetical protein
MFGVVCVSEVSELRGRLTGDAGLNGMTEGTGLGGAGGGKSFLRARGLQHSPEPGSSSKRREISAGRAGNRSDTGGTRQVRGPWGSSWALTWGDGAGCC